MESSKEVGPWRERVALMAHATKGAYGYAVGDGVIPRGHPVEVDIRFYLPRPASLAKKLAAMVKRPDIDKLGRAILDALTDVVFEDDSQVVDLFLRKRYADEAHLVGAQISVRELELVEAL